MGVKLSGQYHLTSAEKRVRGEQLFLYNILTKKLTYFTASMHPSLRYA